MLPKYVCTDIPTTETEKSRNGYKYEAAGGHTIANEGEKEIAFATHEGHLCKMAFQIAEVSKGLGSVADIVDMGHKVVFDLKGLIYGDTCRPEN